MFCQPTAVKAAARFKCRPTGELVALSLKMRSTSVAGRSGRHVRSAAMPAATNAAAALVPSCDSVSLPRRRVGTDDRTSRCEEQGSRSTARTAGAGTRIRSADRQSSGDVRGRSDRPAVRLPAATTTLIPSTRACASTPSSDSASIGDKGESEATDTEGHLDRMDARQLVAVVHSAEISARLEPVCTWLIGLHADDRDRRPESDRPPAVLRSSEKHRQPRAVQRGTPVQPVKSLNG